MTDTLTPTFNEALKLMRERAGFSQAQLAEYLEMGRTSVIRYESGAAVPKWKDVELWATICDHEPRIMRQLWDQARRSGWLYVRPPDERYVQSDIFGGEMFDGDHGSASAVEAA